MRQRLSSGFVRQISGRTGGRFYNTCIDITRTNQDCQDNLFHGCHIADAKTGPAGGRDNIWLVTSQCLEDVV